MITYKVIGYKKSGEESAIYYARPTTIHPVTIDDIAQSISRECTVCLPDIKAVLNSLEYHVISNLKSGLSVRLGDLGSFRPGISGKSTKTLEEWKPSNIKALRVRFTPSSRMHREFNLKTVELQRYQLTAKKPDGGGEA